MLKRRTFALAICSIGDVERHLYNIAPVLPPDVKRELLNANNA